ncbi:MAG: TauD/TfdA family dioxygenase [Rhodospirillales bacterium]|nr:TauD/TfdA family dioxygenase [Rhodospirillales bacterium]
MNTAKTQPVLTPSPFDLQNQSLYEEWRRQKLTGYPQSLGDLVVELKDPTNLTSVEKEALLQRVRKANMVVYVSATGDDPDRNIPLMLAAQLGVSGLNHNWLADADGLTSLTVVSDGTRQHYIPYSNRLIKWHTDGYYNTAAEQIQTLNLHCVSPAAEGGENRLMDHEMAYIHLRDENPEFIQALMAPDAMTIPPRIDEGGTTCRREERGPVFSVCRESGNLHMRYTIRERNVIWMDDPITTQALSCLEGLLEGDHPAIFKGRLESGMGLVSNNVLHDRSGFSDDDTHKRLIYRARYFDRLANTGVRDVYPDLF